MTAGKRPIAVIGAGFSGVLATLHLLRRLPPDQPILLCERNAPDSASVPVAAAEDQHLLNVRVTNMSALADEPQHFEDWLKRRAGPERAGLIDTPAGLFATRGLYQRYLQDTLDDSVNDDSHPAVARFTERITDIVAANHHGFELICADGNRVAVAGVLLALGDLPPEENPDPRICNRAWSDKAWRPLDDTAPVLIVGTGLTMVDLVIAMRRRGFAGPIAAISSRGLLPQRHAPVATWPTPHFTLAEEHSLSLLTARLRDEAFAAAEAGVDWRAVIDSMRPITAPLWSRLALPDRQRFLRHIRRYWDAHRHRSAPPHADAIDAMLADGSLAVLAGRLRALRPAPEAVLAYYTPRGSETERVLSVQRVIMASGVEQIDRTSDALMQRLLDRGLVRLDKQGLGLDVTDGLNVVRDDGTPADRVWALGPIVRGVFWECVAVPDIRVQASHAAVSVVARLREDAPKQRSVLF